MPMSRPVGNRPHPGVAARAAAPQPPSAVTQSLDGCPPLSAEQISEVYQRGVVYRAIAERARDEIATGDITNARLLTEAHDIAHAWLDESMESLQSVHEWHERQKQRAAAREAERPPGSPGRGP